MSGSRRIRDWFPANHELALHSSTPGCPASCPAGGYRLPMAGAGGKFFTGFPARMGRPEARRSRGSCEKLSSVLIHRRGSRRRFREGGFSRFGSFIQASRSASTKTSSLNCSIICLFLEGLASGSDHRIREIGSYSRLSCRNVGKARFTDSLPRRCQRSWLGALKA